MIISQMKCNVEVLNFEKSLQQKNFSEGKIGMFAKRRQIGEYVQEKGLYLKLG